MPELLLGGLPLLRIGNSLVTEMIYAFQVLIIGIHRTCGLDHRPQRFGILQHRTGTEHVLIERLIVVICHENRTLEGIQQTGVMDIAVGIVNEYTGFHIALGIDVQVVASTGNTAPTYSASFWKSMEKMALVLRNSRMR